MTLGWILWCVILISIAGLSATKVMFWWYLRKWKKGLDSQAETLSYRKLLLKTIEDAGADPKAIGTSREDLKKEIDEFGKHDQRYRAWVRYWNGSGPRPRETGR